MTIDATFWVMISFFGFIGLLVYFQIPQKIKSTLDENINNILGEVYIIHNEEFAKKINTKNNPNLSNATLDVIDSFFKD